MASTHRYLTARARVEVLRYQKMIELLMESVVSNLERLRVGAEADGALHCLEALLVRAVGPGVRRGLGLRVGVVGVGVRVGVGVGVRVGFGVGVGVRGEE